MKKRILFIIILILVILMILGSVYFIIYKSNSQAQSENETQISSMPENIINSIEDDANTGVNEVQNDLVEENMDNTVIETTNETTEVTKQETQTTTKNTQTSSKVNNSPSKTNSGTQKKETVTQSTSTPQTTPSQSSSPTSNNQSKPEETKPEPKVERCTNNNNHSMNIGNSGKWFNSKSDAIAYYNQQTKYWGDQWENGEIDNDKYYKNCPSGYEVWDCMFCGKWTINFYYR